MKLLSMMVLLFMFACGANKQVEADASKVQQMDYEILVKESHGGPSEAKQIIFQDEKELQQFFMRVNMTRKPGIPVPVIDFEKEVVVALCVGKVPTSGYSITIDSVHEVEDATEVWLQKQEPAPSDMVATVICQPFTIAKFPRKGNKIEFKFR